MRGTRVGIKPNTPEWLAWRALGITAGDAAKVTRPLPVERNGVRPDPGRFKIMDSAAEALAHIDKARGDE